MCEIMKDAWTRATMVSCHSSLTDCDEHRVMVVWNAGLRAHGVIIPACSFLLVDEDVENG